MGSGAPAPVTRYDGRAGARASTGRCRSSSVLFTTCGLGFAISSHELPEPVLMQPNGVCIPGDEFVDGQIINHGRPRNALLLPLDCNHGQLREPGGGFTLIMTEPFTGAASSQPRLGYKYNPPSSRIRTRRLLDFAENNVWIARHQALLDAIRQKIKALQHHSPDQGIFSPGFDNG